MKLLDALQIVREPRPEGVPFHVALVCGFNPLHFQTFLNAELRRRGNRRPEIRVGLYGDFWGNLQRALHEESEAVVILMEWPDLDPRLGIRNLGGWDPPVLPEIVETARRREEQILNAVASAHVPVVIALPTLPLPPAAFTPGWRASTLELELRSVVARMAAGLARSEGVLVTSQDRLDAQSPLCERADTRSEVTTGFPYQLKHASVLAELISRLLIDVTPKKGLITDLDNTLWRGILGEVGPDGVSWDLDHHSHVHGVYQQFLRSLANAGTLIAVASKNDPALVVEAFRRQDILLPADCVFPFEAHWGPKSESVARIIKSWNIGPDAVVFVDDSRAELAEVQAAHPDVEALVFPTDEPQQLMPLLHRLRDLFGKPSIAEEDSLRLQSLRQAHQHVKDGGDATSFPDAFLQQAEAELTLSFAKQPLDPRAFELINKTNQFNLNGRRYTSAEWQHQVLSPTAFLLVVSYRDKYGPLGKIAVLAGREEDQVIFLDNWVMSCRAFGRRIEQACLGALYERYGASEIEFNFATTQRNDPMKNFLGEVLGAPPSLGSRLPRERFEARRADTLHIVAEVTHG